jgi:hypothetical protein
MRRDGQPSLSWSRSLASDKPLHQEIEHDDPAAQFQRGRKPSARLIPEAQIGAIETSA